MNHTATKLIKERFISPTEKERSDFIGIEIEMPVINLCSGVTDKNASIDAFYKAAGRFDFTLKRFDLSGVCHEAVCESTGDIFSFDCSYNNFEISLGRVRTLHEAQARFEEYVRFINEELRKNSHTLSGLGINPFYRLNQPNFVPAPRYKMLEGYLRKAEVWERADRFHPYPAYPTFSSASQVQLDVKRENLVRVIRVFSLLEPVKALLFSNSLMADEPRLLCVRDMLWEKSTHGINPRNVGFFEPLPSSCEELSAYIAKASLFCAERDGRYLFFYPVPFEEYIRRDSIEGEYFDGEKYQKLRFIPHESDIDHLRTYKHVDLTARGTLEFRSACTQPLSEVLTVSAFHLGLMNRAEELEALLQNNSAINFQRFSPARLRALFVRRELPDFVDQKELSSLLSSVLSLAESGLSERGFSEERYLKPLFLRAESLASPAKNMADRLSHGGDIRDIITDYASL